MDSGTKVDSQSLGTRRGGPTWSAGSNGHVGTLELDVGGIRLGLEIYRTPDGELLWLWRDGTSGRVCHRSTHTTGSS